jgi:hypothetical protein
MWVATVKMHFVSDVSFPQNVRFGIGNMSRKYKKSTVLILFGETNCKTRILSFLEIFFETVIAVKPCVPKLM